MNSLFLTVETQAELEQVQAYLAVHDPKQFELVPVINAQLMSPALSALQARSKVCLVPFVNGLPMLDAHNLAAAGGEWVGFASGLGLPVDTAPVADDGAHWRVSDSWACLPGGVPLRRERARQSEGDYGRFQLSGVEDFAAHLQQCGEPSWLLAQQANGWLRKSWLLQLAAGARRLSPHQWLHRRLRQAFAGGETVVLTHAPQAAATHIDALAKGEEERILWLQRELVGWLELLCDVYADELLVRLALQALLPLNRPWLLTDRGAADNLVGQLSSVFRQQYPQAPLLRSPLLEGVGWRVMAEAQIDRIQVASFAYAESFAAQAGAMTLATIRHEWVRLDRLLGVECFDATLQDPDGQFMQLMALYRDGDGRWVLPSLLASWPEDALNRLSELLQDGAKGIQPNHAQVRDAALAREIEKSGAGRFLPGLEGYATLVQHALRYRAAADLGPLGRVLDCASGAGYGWHILADAGSMADYTGIDLNADAIRFSQRFIPGDAENCRFEARLLNTLPLAAYDTVISFETIEHTDDPELFLWELSERIAAGGRLLLSLPTERWAGSHLNPTHWTNWTESRVRRLCSRVFEKVDLHRLRLSLVSPETFQSGLLHQNCAESGEDEGFLLVLEQPRPRSLAKRVVVQRRFAMGDALLASSVLPALRRKYPDRQLLVRTQVVEAFQAIEEADIVGCMSLLQRPDDIFIDLDGAYENARDLHIIEAYARRSGVAPGAPSLPRLMQDYRPLANKIVASGWLAAKKPEHLVAIHMAASSPDRIWPAARWGELLPVLAARDIGLVLLGSGKDFTLENLPEAARAGVVSLVNELRLAETAAAISVADMLIAPDSGLIHIAHAVGTPVLGLFGMAEPAQRLPLRGASRGLIADIECKGCLAELPAEAAPLCRRGHAYCMDMLTVESVLTAATGMLQEVPNQQWRSRLLQNIPLPFSWGKANRLQNESRQDISGPANPVLASPEAPRRKPRIGVLTRDALDEACYRLRLGDALQLVEKEFDHYYYKHSAAYLYDGVYPFGSDDDFVREMDIFLVQRLFPRPESKALLEKLVESGKPIVYEVDDWLPEMPESHLMYKECESSFEQIKWLLPKCALVTVTTEPLAEKVRPFNDKVFVFTNTLARDRFVTPRPRNDKVTIGFAGTTSRGKEMAAIEPALMRIYREYAGLVKFVFWGEVPKSMVGMKDVRQVTTFVNYSKFLTDLADLRLDIGIAPLAHGAFNDSKSDLKWLEYSVVGAATVLSDTPAYAWLKDSGMASVVENTEQAWFEALAALVEDADLRERRIALSQHYIKERRVLEDAVPLLFDQWRQLLPKNLRPNGISEMGKVTTYAFSEPEQFALRDYRRWLGNHNLREIHAEQLAESMCTAWQSRPWFNLIVLAPQTRLTRLAESLAALENQLYPNWRLIVLSDSAVPDPVFNSSDQLGWVQLDDLSDFEAVAATINGVISEVASDWTWLLPAGFRLQPQALLRFGEAIHQHPDWKAVYCDSDVVSPMGERFLPAFRPDFSPEYLRSMDYIGDAVAFSTTALSMLGGFQPYPGAYNFDALLRLFELQGSHVIGHVDDMLLSLPWRHPDQQPLCLASCQVALEEHAKRCDQSASVGPGLVDGSFHFEYQVQGSPLVSIIIPTRDKLEYLEPCIDSVLQRTAYQHFELIIVDNRSEQPETQEYYQALQASYPGRVQIVAYDQPFNFSAQCNLGAAHARGDYLLLLNNDTELALESWLERMLATAQQPGVGVVGARLLYPEVGQIQHAGIVLGLPGGMHSVADHVFEPQDMNLPGYMNRAVTMQNYSAVTGACLMVAKSTYLDVGGMDEEKFQVCFNDVDLCLKVQAAGWRNVYNPFAVMYHHHAKSIGRTTSDPRIALQAAVRERGEMENFLHAWMPVLKRDPGFNRHLSLRKRRMELETERHVSWDPSLGGRQRVLGVPVPGGSGEYRLSQPLSVLQEHGLLDGEILQPVHGLPSLVEMARMAPDVLLLHTAVNDGVLDALGQYRSYFPGIRTILGIDDLVGGTPLKSDLYDHWRRHYPDAKQRLRRALNMSDALVVSTEPLREFTQGMVGEVAVIPNRLRRSIWGELQAKRRVGAKPRVGWVGASQHRGDLELLFEVIKQTHQEVDWVFMGMCLPQFRPYVAEAYQGVPFSEYPEKVATLNLDLAVAPLEMNAFNEAKSNLRLLEYGAMGWPVVCTDIYPYQTNGAPVCRVPNDVSVWVDAIRSRAHDLDQAEREGDLLRAWVERDYWLEDHHEDWAKVLRG
ncbi:glycosyltransferase [Chromobacterium haemolyticum]|uniref:glycosyltransferase n=1 Tax=Chromobacterium haemolyticum TaxID=394935 RepID=UPI001592FA25|nr:glycosyltransferase [Chromobacterium haemolyticum]